MRPDEHKKRKNTEYKKKHGLKGDSKQQSSSRSDDKQVKGTKHVIAKSEKPGTRDNRNIKEKSDEVDSPEEDISYRKRQLVSNWSRYDDILSDDDDDIPLQRGEDFTKLLAQAGGSEAQFRFKDEEDWSGDIAGASANLLALDLENIAQSLLCIPLHERLGINQHVFTAEQLVEIESSAEECQKKYDPTMVATIRSEQSKPSHVSKVPKHVLQEIFINNAEPYMKTDRKQPNDTDKVIEKVKCNDNPIVEKAKSSEKNAEISSLEDDLDMLLSINEPVAESVDTSHGVIEHDCLKKNIEDKETSKSEQVPHADKESKVKEESSVNKESSKGDDLEDWLDSMLDD